MKKKSNKKSNKKKPNKVKRKRKKKKILSRYVIFVICMYKCILYKVVKYSAEYRNDLIFSELGESKEEEKSRENGQIKERRRSKSKKIDNHVFLCTLTRWENCYKC